MGLDVNEMIFTPHPLTPFLTLQLPSSHSYPTFTLPPYLHSPSPHSLFSILAAILHLGNIQFFKVSTEVASTAQWELVTGCPLLSNSPLHVLVAPVCTDDPSVFITLMY